MYKERYHTYGQVKNMAKFKDMFSFITDGMHVNVYYFPPTYYNSKRVTFAELGIETYKVWF